MVPPCVGGDEGTNRVSAGLLDGASPSLAVAQSGPGAGRDRQCRRPTRLLDHQASKFFSAGEAFRDLSHDFIVHMQHNWVSSSLDPQHRPDQQITCDSADDVFGPEPAIRTGAVAAVAELAVRTVGEHNGAMAGIEQFGSCEGIGKLSAARQFQE